LSNQTAHPFYESYETFLYFIKSFKKEARTSYKKLEIGKKAD